MISVIILAAGESRRFGSPKALAQLDNNSYVIDYVISNLLNIDDLEIITVLGAHKELIQPVLLKHTTARIVYNKDYNFGQASSFRKGVSMAAETTSGFILLPVDCPLVKVSTITNMIATFKELNPTLLIPTYKGRKGHPPLFNASLRKEILTLDNNTALNAYQKQKYDETTFVDVDDEGVLLTFNTQQEFNFLKNKFCVI